MAQGLIEALEEIVGPKARPCKMARIVAALTDDERAALDRALDAGAKPGPIARALTKAGHQISNHTTRQHMGGGCCCVAR